MKLKTINLFGIIMLAVLVVIIGVGSFIFRQQHEKEPIYPGPGVTGKGLLSDYYPGLKGTGGDTDIYFLDSGNPGGTFLIYGGTHGPEIAGVIAAITIIENVEVQTGRLIVIPHSNESAYTWTEPGQGHPDRIEVTTYDGSKRWFRYGSRGTNPIHQWPDQEAYIHYPSGQILAPDEARNLNRNHPGKEGGTLTQKIAYGIYQLIVQEKVDIVLDQHEAPPEKPLVDAVCSHQDALDLVTWAAMYVEDYGIELRIEQSPVNLHGFSHRELGDATDVFAVLSETVNPLQGAVHGKIDAEVAITGQDKFYDLLAENGKLKVKWNDFGEPLDYRVGRNLTVINELCNSYNDLFLGKEIIIDNIPLITNTMEDGLGVYLHPLE